MDELTSPQGAVALAVSALLLVLGYRLARPVRGREWLALGAYALALVAQLLGARGLLPGPALVPGLSLRIAGGVLLVAGLLLAGKPSRARRRGAIAALPRAASPRRPDPVYAGLGLVVVGQLARAPSLAAAVATIVAVLACAAVALAPERGIGAGERALR
jgi:hypothetical protein